MRRIVYVAATAAGLCLMGSSPAQPGPGGPPRGRGDGPDVRALQAQLEKLTAQVKELEAKLARTQESTDRLRPAAGDRPAPKEGARPAPKEGSRFNPNDRPEPNDGERRGPRRNFGGFGGGGPPMARFRDGDRPGPGFGGPDRGGPPFARRFGPDGPPRRGSDRAPMPREVSGPPNVGRRIDRIIDELEQLKKELPGPRR